MLKTKNSTAKTTDEDVDSGICDRTVDSIV